MTAETPLGREQIFGPLYSIVRWADSEYGLAAYVYIDLAAALWLGERIDTGMVGINQDLVSDPAAPFGGMQPSGREGLEEYLNVDWS